MLERVTLKELIKREEEKKPGRFIKKLKEKKEEGKRFGVGDIETVKEADGTLEPIAAGFMFQGMKTPKLYGRGGKKGKEKIMEKLVEEIENYNKKEKNKEKSVIYFHNLKGFDGVYILKGMIEKGKKDGKYPTIIMEGKKIVRIETENVIYKDSRDYLEGSLNTLSKEFLNQEKEKYDIEKLTWENLEEEWKNVEKYIRKDIKLLMGVMEELQKMIQNEFGLDIVKHNSLPGIALNIYRKKYMEKENIYLSKSNPRVEEFIRKAYKGGRVEIYQSKSEGKVYVYDINSAYPEVMKREKYPVGKPKEEEKEELEKGGWKEEGKVGFVKARVRVPEKLWMGPLPKREGEKGKLFFPKGEFEEYFFTEELKLAEEEGVEILEITEGYMFNAENIFEEYMEDQYMERKLAKKMGEKGKERVYKNLMNMLYGRMGINKEINEARILKKEKLEDYKQTLGEDNLKIYELEGEELVLVKVNQEILAPWEKMEEEKAEIDGLKNYKIMMGYVATQIAAAVTAYGRIKLYKLIKELRKEGYRIYYTDTDAIMIDKEIQENSKKLGEKMGKLRKEGEYEKGVFIGEKKYALKGKEEDRIKLAGVSGKKGISYEIIERVEETGESYKIEQEKEFKKDLKKLKIKTEKETYEIKREGEKRKWKENGQTEMIDADTIIGRIKLLEILKNQKQIHSFNIQNRGENTKEDDFYINVRKGKSPVRISSLKMIWKEEEYDYWAARNEEEIVGEGRTEELKIQGKKEELSQIGELLEEYMKEEGIKEGGITTIVREGEEEEKYKMNKKGIKRIKERLKQMENYKEEEEKGEIEIKIRITQETQEERKKWNTKYKWEIKGAIRELKKEKENRKRK